LPRNSRPAASSTSKSEARTTGALGRTPPHSARSAPARKPASATSLAPSCSVLAASLCLPLRQQAQCSTPPRPNKMPFTYRSRDIFTLPLGGDKIMELRHEEWVELPRSQHIVKVKRDRHSPSRQPVRDRCCVLRCVLRDTSRCVERPLRSIQSYGEARTGASRGSVVKKVFIAAQVGLGPLLPRITGSVLLSLCRRFVSLSRVARRQTIRPGPPRPSQKPRDPSSGA